MRAPGARLPHIAPWIGDVGSAPATNDVRKALGIRLGVPHPPVRLRVTAFVGADRVEVEANGGRKVVITETAWREWGRFVSEWASEVPEQPKNTTGEQLTLLGGSR